MQCAVKIGKVLRTCTCHYSLLACQLSTYVVSRHITNHKSHKVEVGIFDLRSDVVRVEGFISSQIILISAFEGKMYR